MAFCGGAHYIFELVSISYSQDCKGLFSWAHIHGGCKLFIFESRTEPRRKRVILERVLNAEG